MNVRHQKVVAVIACAVYLSGCASIVSGGPKTLPIMSKPDGATCEIVNVNTGDTITKVTTPYTATLERSAGFFSKAKYKIRLSKDGYIPEEQAIEAGVNGWYFGNIVFGGLLGLLIIDPATGAMWKIHEDNVKLTLYADTADGRSLRQKDLEAKAAAAAVKDPQTEAMSHMK